MKRALLIAAAFAAWVIGTFSLAHVWLTNPGMFPTLPMSLWNWLDSIYRSRNAEEVADLELIVALTMWSIILLVSFVALIVIWRLLQRSRANKSSQWTR